MLRSESGRSDGNLDTGSSRQEVFAIYYVVSQYRLTCLEITGIRLDSESRFITVHQRVQPLLWFQRRFLA